MNITESQTFSATNQAAYPFIGEKLVYSGAHAAKTTIELIQFDKNQVHCTQIPTNTPLQPWIQEGKVNWFCVKGFSNSVWINQICLDAQLHQFDVRDLLSAQKVVKVVLYDNVTFVLMSAFHLQPDSQLCEAQVALVVGKDFIISFQEFDIPIFDQFKQNLENHILPLQQKGEDYFLYIMLNAVNSLNMLASITMEDELMTIEERLVDQEMDRNILHLLRKRRMDYMRIRRFILSLREEYSNLLHNTNHVIQPGNIVYFNDYDDRLRTTLGNLESFHEALFSLLDLYYNNNNLIMNQIIKRLTLVSTIFIPLTFLAGVWGMNFESVPELHWRFGYLFAWLCFSVIALSIYLLMRKKKWF